MIGGTLLTLCWTWMRAPAGILAAVEGVVAGAVFSVALQLPLFLRTCPIRISADAQVRSVLLLGTPLLVAGLFRLEPQVDRYLASAMPEGSIARLGYSRSLVQALLVLSTSGLGVVLFPVISRLAAERNFADLRRELERALQFLALTLTPLVPALWFFGEPVVAALFQRGKFTADDSRTVAMLLFLQVGVIVGGGLGDVFAKVFYALSDTRMPVLIGTAGFALGIALKFAWNERWGVDGLVLASSIYVAASAVAMGLVLHRRVGSFVTREFCLTLARSVAATSLALIAAWQVWQNGGSLAICWAALSGAAVYGIALLILREPVLADVRSFTAKLKRRESAIAPPPDEHRLEV
jgi:putative peptidoglycan lipid II flippase